MRARSHDIIAIDHCPLFSPGMAGAISAAQALSRDLRGLMKPLDIGVTATLGGLDVDLRGSGPLGRNEAQKLTHTADALDLARVSNHGEIVIGSVDRPASRLARRWRGCRPAASCKRPRQGKRGSLEFAERALAGTKRRSWTCSAAARALRAEGSPVDAKVFRRRR